MPEIFSDSMDRDGWFNSFYDEELPDNGNLASKVALSHFKNIFKVVNLDIAPVRHCAAVCFMYNNHPTTPCHFYVRDGTTNECFLGSGDYTNGSIVPSTSTPLSFGMNKSKEFADLPMCKVQPADYISLIKLLKCR